MVGAAIASTVCFTVTAMVRRLPSRSKPTSPDSVAASATPSASSSTTSPLTAVTVA